MDGTHPARVRWLREVAACCDVRVNAEMHLADPSLPLHPALREFVMDRYNFTSQAMQPFFNGCVRMSIRKVRRKSFLRLVEMYRPPYLVRLWECYLYPYARDAVTRHELIAQVKGGRIVDVHLIQDGELRRAVVRAYMSAANLSGILQCSLCSKDDFGEKEAWSLGCCGKASAIKFALRRIPGIADRRLRSSLLGGIVASGNTKLVQDMVETGVRFPLDARQYADRDQYDRREIREVFKRNGYITPPGTDEWEMKQTDGSGCT